MRRVLTGIAALLLLNASVTFSNWWPTPGVWWDGSPSVELSVLLLVLAFAATLGYLRPPASRIVRWLGIGWLVLVLGISLYSSRQQTMVRGGGRIHAGVMAAWTVIWVITVTVGASNDLPWPWWLAGGVGMLASPLVGAWVVLRRTEAAQ